MATTNNKVEYEFPYEIKEADGDIKEQFIRDFQGMWGDFCITFCESLNNCERHKMKHYRLTTMTDEEKKVV